ncbi:MAG: nuclear transport factor 2 family protein [Steroidobacteraceae bacterium]
MINAKILVMPLVLALCIHSETGMTQTIERPAREIARQFIQAFYVERDKARSIRDFVAPDLIEHNPEMPNGLKANVDFLSVRKLKEPGKYPPSGQWAHVLDHIIIDGDLFAVHHHVFMDPNDPGLDVMDFWRVANGRIVEHWDVIQSVPAQPINGNTLWCGKGADYASAKQWRNSIDMPSCGPVDKTAQGVDSLAVVKAYLSALGPGKVRAAFETYSTTDYRQHSPVIGNGADETIAFLEQASARPRAKSTVARILTEGDLVLIHRHSEATDDKKAAVGTDLFRIKNGKIVEHWDMHQEVAPASVNGNTMW